MRIPGDKRRLHEMQEELVGLEETLEQKAEAPLVERAPFAPGLNLQRCPDVLDSGSFKFRCILELRHLGPHESQWHPGDWQKKKKFRMSWMDS